MAAIGTLIARVDADVSGFMGKMAAADARMRGVGSSMQKSGARMASIGATMTKGVTLPIVAGLGFAVKAAADFESSLNTMQAVSGATGAQMKQVSKLAKDLGADITLPGTSAADAADAMTNLAKSGLSVNQTMKAAKGVLQLSAAAQIENAEAATIVGDALNAFNLKGKDAVRVADLLAASANASSSDIDDMALALKQSSAVAAQANVPIEDTVTALSNLANAGIKGSDAGTSLKTMLLRLMAPVGTGAKAIKELGIETRTAGGELKTMPALAEEFRRKTEGMTKAQKDAAFAAIFGTDAIRAANVLLRQGGDAHEAMREKVTKQGAAAELAGAKMKGFSGSLEAFKSAVETAAISVGEILLPMATRTMQRITELVDAFDKLSPAAKRNVVAFAGFAAAVGPALLIFGKLSQATAAMPAGLRGMVGPLGLAAAALALGASQSSTFRASLIDLSGAVRPVVSALLEIVGNPFAASFAASAAAAYGLVKAFMAAKAALIALNAAAVASPMTAFLVAAGAVVGALGLLAARSASGAASLRSVQDAARSAAAAVDSLRSAMTQLEAADLGVKRASLEVTRAKADYSRVLEDVRKGTLKGRDADIARRDALLRIKEAENAHSAAIDRRNQAMGDAIQEAHKAVTSNTDLKEKIDRVADATRQAAVVRRNDTEALAKQKVEAQKVVATTTAQIRENNKLIPTLRQQAKGTGDGARAAGNYAEILTEQNRELAAARGRAQAAAAAIDQAGGAASGASGKVAGLGGSFAAAGVQAASAAAKVALLNGQLAAIPRQISVSVNIGVTKVTTVLQRIQRVVKENKELPRASKELGASMGRSMSTSMAREFRSSRSKNRLTSAVKEALHSAKSSAMSIAEGLAGRLSVAIDITTARRTAGIDEDTQRRLAALGDTPEAKRLREVIAAEQAMVEAEEKASRERERMRLNDAINTAETAEDRARAEQDLREWQAEQDRRARADTLARERQQLEDSLAQQERKISDEADAKKKAAEDEAEERKRNLSRGLADLTDSFNRGLISQDQYEADRTALIAQYAPEHQMLGELLGSAFAGAYQDELTALIRQIQEIARWGRGAAGISGMEPGVERPLDVAIREWQEHLDELKKQHGDTIRAAQEEGSPAGKKYSPGERKAIDSLKARIARWQALRPKAYARGGEVPATGPARDYIPAMLRPGERVLSPSENRRRGSGWSEVVVNVNIAPGTGISREQARMLAREIQPELSRQVRAAV